MKDPIKVKVVVVAMFERGTPDDGDPGELELWVQRKKLDIKIPFPNGHFDLRMNQDGLLAVLTGMGPTNAATIVTALGLDPRFDLSKAYWIVAGIAGVNPFDASIGSAAWAEYIVDGDLMHEMDSREIPDEWQYGKLALFMDQPNTRSSHPADQLITYKLNKGLVDWAYELTKDYPLKDYPELVEYRALYEGYPNAIKPPFVLKGDSFGSGSFWHGEILNKWAEDWTRMYTEGKGNFVMSNMEDNGTARALTQLSKGGRVDFDRLLVLRTASNYTTPPPGRDAQWHFDVPFILNGIPSIEAAYELGRVIAEELIGNWEKYEDNVPGSA